MDPWPSVAYETLPWHREVSELLLVSKTQRRRVRSTYEAAIPAPIAPLAYEPPPTLATRLSTIARDLVRFDERQRTRGFDLPALLLRSESAASSSIEHLTSSVRNVALAQLTPKAPKNAELIARNIAAMRRALAHGGPLDVPTIVDVHGALMGSGEDGAGGLRREQVWVGGTFLSPHGATFVPPRAERVEGCLEDLLGFVDRSPTPDVALVAIAHAQFETIHPFADGNGRTGRALIHTLLRQRGILRESTLPLSAGLLASVERYHAALGAYQQGDPQPIVEEVAGALELALELGEALSARIASLLGGWEGRISERSTAAIRRLPAVLVEQPVVDVGYVAQRLGLTERAARNVVARAVSYGFLRPIGNAHRGVFYQADAITDVLDAVAAQPALLRESP